MIDKDRSLELKDFFRNSVNSVKEKINPVIVNNPIFEELLYKELSYFYGKTLSTNFDIVVSDDKNSVSITSFNPIVDFGNVALREKNSGFIKSVFYLENNNLVCDYNQGVLFDRKSIEESGIRTKVAYETKLETNYSRRYFDENGIEYSDNSFSDIYKFDYDKNEIDLRELVMSSFHKPQFSEYLLPTIPIHVMKGMARNTYRKKGSMAVIHSNIGIATSFGYKRVSSSLYACHPTIPEMLRGGILFAKTDEDDFRFNLVGDYAPDMQKCYERAKNELKEAIINSNLKEYSEKTYNALLNNL